MNATPTTTIVLTHVLLVQGSPRGFAELAASTGLPFVSHEPAAACRLIMSDGHCLLIEQKHEAALKAALARGDRTIEIDGRCERVPDRVR
jgi:hypothetical protein